MSVVKRILSGSAAAWSRIFVTLAGQIALVPVILSHWSIEQYGCWLVIQSVTGLSTVLSFGHQNYIGFEFLKCGGDKIHKLALIFYSAIPYAIVIGLVELVAVLGFIHFGILTTVFDSENKLSGALLNEATWALVIQSIVWLLVSCVGGLAGRLLASLGHFPRNAWWGVLGAFLILMVTTVVVIIGGGILQTAYVIAFTTVLYNIALYIDFWKLIKKHGINPVRPDWKMGVSNLVQSFAIALNTLLDLLRQQGLRVFLSALMGIKEMTAFSTMRTASNVALQGIGTVTNPIFPELMRFLRNRDQERTDAILAFVWFFAVIVLAPLLVIFQAIMPNLFVLWTRGKVEFDPIVFGLFSIALIIYSVAQPAVSLLQGNNLLKEQLFVTTLAALTVVLGVIFVTPIFGIRGAAAVLVMGEIASCISLVTFAKRWLAQNNMNWPWKLFALTLIAAISSALLILTLANFSAYTNAILFFAVILGMAMGGVFIRQMPSIAKDKLNKLVAKEI